MAARGLSKGDGSNVHTHCGFSRYLAVHDTDEADQVKSRRVTSYYFFGRAGVLTYISTVSVQTSQCGAHISSGTCCASAVP